MVGIQRPTLHMLSHDHDPTNWNFSRFHEYIFQSSNEKAHLCTFFYCVIKTYQNKQIKSKKQKYYENKKKFRDSVHGQYVYTRLVAVGFWYFEAAVLFE